MGVIGIDLGGTKVSAAVFDEFGNLQKRDMRLLEGRTGSAVGELIADVIKQLIPVYSITGAGICIPGIVYSKKETVWAPNIPGWENFPLKKYVREALSDKDISIAIESDRTCYILGEKWKGAAKDCDNAIYLAVGTGIGAGILLDGRVIHGSNDVVGATGWMALEPPYNKEFDQCGCFETYASGNGIGYQARKELVALKKSVGIQKFTETKSALRDKPVETVTSHDVFASYPADPVAVKVLNKAVQMWGMGAANLVSLFDPQKIIFGGGVFGPAVQFIPEIYKEACKWGQPISMKNVKFCATEVQSDAALLGAAYMVLGKEFI